LAWKWLTLASGHNATDALGHATADITRSSYLDPSIIGGVKPADVLFRPGQSNGVVSIDVSPSDAKRLPRAKAIK